MDTDAERVCKSCHGCQVVGQANVPEPMKRTQMPTGPWQDVAVDLMGPIPTGENLLVIVDYYSRYYEVVVMHSTTLEKIFTVLNDIFARFGYPHSLKSEDSSLARSSKGFCRKQILNIGLHHHFGHLLMVRWNARIARFSRH